MAHFRRMGPSANPQSGSDVLGHPRGLVYLCVSEAWERFSYFGMQSLLVLYMTHQLLLPGHVERVAGFAAFRAAIEQITGPLSTLALASQTFGLYTGLVYLTPLVGGLVADRWLNRTATVTIGALLMAMGHFLMAFEASFLVAIALLLVGVGCFKGNIASQVGELYDRRDLRRATAFQAFQFSITSAVIVSPLVCGTLGEKVGWHFGFGAAGVGMLIGLGLYLHGRRWLPAARQFADGSARPSLSASDWKVLALLIGLLPLVAGAMVGNQQMFNAFVVWGEANFDLHLLGYEMPVTWLLSFDAVISALCILASIAFWRAFARRWKEPEDLTKIAVGAAIMALAPLLLSLAGLRQEMTGERISVLWGLAFEVVNEAGFAMLVPVALSFYSRVAPAALQGMTIAMFYVNSFICNLVVGRLGGLLEQMSAASFWLLHAAIVGASASLLVVVAMRGLVAERSIEPEHAV
jgi:POT family proton-dependent oligopeptide transporter